MIRLLFLSLWAGSAQADVVLLPNDVALEGIISETSAEGVMLQVGKDGFTFIEKSNIIKVERQSAGHNRGLRARWDKEDSESQPQDLPILEQGEESLTLYQGQWLTDAELRQRLAFDDADIGTGRLDHALATRICGPDGMRIPVQKAVAARWFHSPEREGMHQGHWQRHLSSWPAVPLVRYNTNPSIPYNAVADIPYDTQADVPYNRPADIPYNTRASIPYGTRAAVPYNARAPIPYNTRAPISYNTLPLMRRNTAPAIPYGSTPSRHRRTTHGTSDKKRR